MGIESSKANQIIAKALDYRSMRQDMIASNIANADTPFYKPRDINFEETLKAKKEELFNQQAPSLQMAQTNEAHMSSKKETSSLKPTVFFRDGHMAKNDGNSVDIDVETTEMSKNSVMFNAIIQARKKDSAIFTSVIEASKKL